MKKRIAKISLLAVTGLVALLIAGCFAILSVNQPASVQGLEQFTASLRVEIAGQSDANPHYGIVGLLIPNDWQVDSVWFEGAYNDYCTFLHPDSSDAEPGGQVDYWADSLEARYPSGPNLQWVIYQSSTSHLTLVSTDTVDLFVTMTPSATQGIFDLGYFVTDAALDFTDPTYYSVSLNNSITVSGVIPVELTSFAAIGNKNGVELRWETASETNNRGFDIEKSMDGLIFSKIGFVNGNGTTTQRSSYQFIDKSPLTGKQFYRLKQIDFNGTFDYSKVVEISPAVPQEFTLGQNYPNPFNPSTTINFGVPVESEITLSIYNSLGQLVKVVASGIYQAGNHNLNFSADELSTGTYYYNLKAKGSDGSEFNKTAKMLLLK